MNNEEEQIIPDIYDRNYWVFTKEDVNFWKFYCFCYRDEFISRSYIVDKEMRDESQNVTF